MNSNPKIVVFHLKELIYTAIFIIFAILLIILLIFMFQHKSDDKANVTTDSEYTAGVYTSSITVNGSPMDLQVTVDEHNINAIELKNTDEAVSAMYPLIFSSVDDISKQIVSTQSLNNISCTDDCKYTYDVLIDSIETTLEKAKKNKSLH